MKKSCISVLLLGFIWLPNAVYAQLPARLTQLVRTGLENNLGLQIEKVTYALQQAESVVADAAFDPGLTASVGYERSSTPYESSTGFSGPLDSATTSAAVGVAQQFRSGTSAELSLSTQYTSDNDISNDLDDRYRTALVLELTQPLLQGLGQDVNSTALTTSRNKEEQTVYSYLLQVQGFILQLETTYWQLAAAQQLVQLRQQSVALATDLLQANEKRYRAGAVAITEVQEAETARADRDLAISQAQQQQQLLLQSMRRLVVAEVTASTDMDTAFDEQTLASPALQPDMEALRSDAWGKRLELKINDYDLANSGLQLDYQRDQIKPRLDLVLQGGLSGLAGEDRGYVSGSRYQGDYFDSVSGLSQADGWQWQAGLKFSMPLGQRAARARLQQAGMQLRQNQYKRQDLQLLIADELEQERINLASAWEQLQVAERFTRLARISLRQEQRRLEEGLSNTFRVVSFQEKLITARAGQINAALNYRLAQARMDYVRGDMFSRHQLIVTRHAQELKLENL